MVTERRGRKLVLIDSFNKCVRLFVCKKLELFSCLSSNLESCQFTWKSMRIALCRFPFPKHSLKLNSTVRPPFQPVHLFHTTLQSSFDSSSRIPKMNDSAPKDETKLYKDLYFSNHSNCLYVVLRAIWSLKRELFDFQG
jgi:hypothetical protein